MADRKGYIGRAPGDSSVTIARKTFEPTGVQTNFTFDAGYDPGYCDVYLNGAKLISGNDYTASNGSTVGLTSEAQNGDIVEIVAYKRFNLGVPLSDITGDLDVTGNISVSSSITVGGGTGEIHGAYVGDGSQLTGVASTDFIITGTAATFNTQVRVLNLNVTGVTTTTSFNVGSATTIDGGGINVTGVITATSFSGDGSNLTGISGVTINNNADNRLISGSGSANTLNGESNLTFDGSTLALTGSQTVSSNLTVGSGITMGSAGILTATSVDVRDQISGFNSLVGTASSTTKTYAVTVDSKTSNHRYKALGSALGYYIDGVESPFITLLPGKTYKFDQSDSSNNNHPLRFYLDPGRVTIYETNITTSGTAGNAGAATTISVVEETPSVLYYQCTQHGYMGNAVGNDSNQITTPYEVRVGAAFSVGSAGVVTATSFSGAISGTTGTFSSAVNVDATTDSTSATSGALIVDGGLGVAKNVFIGAGLSVAGTLTYEDVTNVDSVGLVTAKSGVNVTGGQLQVGVAYSVGNAGVVTAKGATFNGDVTFTGANTTLLWDNSTDDLIFGDNAKAMFGAGSDLNIYHDGSNSYLTNGTGVLILQTGSLQIKNAAGNESLIRATADGNAELYYDNTKRLETTNDGTVTTGIATATAIEAGVALWVLGANGSSHYTFTGPGNLSGTDDPTINLIRGQKYVFRNNSGGSHPFQIRLSNGGSAYSTGVTNNGAASGDIVFDVPYDAPASLYYQCTNHSSMGGAIYISGSGYETKIGENITLGTAGVVTATKYIGDGSGLSGVGGDTDITSCLFV